MAEHDGWNRSMFTHEERQALLDANGGTLSAALIGEIKKILHARELDWRANAANAWEMGVSDGITAAAQYAYPEDEGKRMMVMVFTKHPTDNPYADEHEVTMMEEFGNLVRENSDLRAQIRALEK